MFVADRRLKFRLLRNFFDQNPEAFNIRVGPYLFVFSMRAVLKQLINALISDAAWAFFQSAKL